MAVEDRLDKRKWVEGPNGEFLIESQKDGNWSVSKVTELHSGLKTKKRVEGSHPTSEKALKHARQLAGRVPPPPDRRGLIEHTRKLL